MSEPVRNETGYIEADLYPPSPGARKGVLRSLIDRHEPLPGERKEATGTGLEQTPLEAALAQLTDLQRQVTELPVPGRIALTDGMTQQDRLRDFPYQGVMRRLVRRTGAGGLYALTATPTLLVPDRANRVGLIVSNDYASDAAAVLILNANLLSDDAAGSPFPLPSIILPPGGYWDGSLGRDVSIWCGSLSAYAQAGAVQTQGAVGQVTAPTAGQVIATLTPGPGTYTVQVTPVISGTVLAGDLVNWELKVGATVISSFVTGVDSAPILTFPDVIVPAATAVTVNAIAAGGAAATYTAGIRTQATVGQGTVTLAVAEF